MKRRVHCRWNVHYLSMTLKKPKSVLEVTVYLHWIWVVQISPTVSYYRSEIHWMRMYLGQATIPWCKYKCNNVPMSQLMWHSIEYILIFFLLLLLWFLFCECSFRLCTFLEVGEFRLIWPIILTMTCVCIRRFSNA